MHIIREGLVQVFTFKTGMLSKIAHDLRFTLHRFELRVEEDARTVHGRFWPDSLQVDGVMKAGKLESDTLRPADKAEITHNVRSKILHTEHYPEVRLEARVIRTQNGLRAEGQLELVGRKHAIAFDVREAATRLAGEVEFHPSQWGIPPFKAILGAIKLQDRVRLAFDLPQPGGVTVA